VKLVPAVLLAALLLPAAPAHAEVLGTTAADDLVLKNRCVRHPISYDLVVSPGTLLWHLDIQVVSPSGRTSEGVEVSSEESSPTSGVVRVPICGSAEPGTWTVRTTGFYQVLPLANIPVSIADTTFQVRRTPTRTTLTGKHLRGQRHLLVATVTDRRRSGFKPTDSAEVRFQRKVDGAWRTIRGSRTLTNKGIASTVVTVSRGTTVRAVTAHAGYLGGSRSRAVRVGG
jgi:hypothetical protein